MATPTAERPKLASPHGWSFRVHQALGYRTPMAVWREGIAGAKAVDMMDNAAALPTCPQQQKQTKPLAA